MSILHFSAPQAHGFSEAERAEFASVFARGAPQGLITGLEFGETDRGDPQVYFIGPAPERDCVLCISRIGRRYIVEDGAGLLIGEKSSLGAVKDAAARSLSARKAGLVARLAVAWYAARELFEEKIEPLTAEAAEIVNHVAPQLAAFV
jgi:hypothetical protein